MGLLSVGDDERGQVVGERRTLYPEDVLAEFASESLETVRERLLMIPAEG
jgi:hypothetical protein